MGPKFTPISLYEVGKNEVLDTEWRWPSGDGDRLGDVAGRRDAAEMGNWIGFSPDLLEEGHLQFCPATMVSDSWIGELQDIKSPLLTVLAVLIFQVNH